MATKVIKLTDNSNNTLLPVTDSSYIQIATNNAVKSVRDVILENEEIMSAIYTDLNERVEDLENSQLSGEFLTELDALAYINTAGTGLVKDGQTLNHESSITASTENDFYTISFNSSGHVTEAVSAKTIDIGVLDASYVLTSGFLNGIGINQCINPGTMLMTMDPFDDTTTYYSIPEKTHSASSGGFTPVVPIGL